MVYITQPAPGQRDSQSYIARTCLGSLQFKHSGKGLEDWLANSHLPGCSYTKIREFGASLTDGVSPSLPFARCSYKAGGLDFSTWAYDREEKEKSILLYPTLNLNLNYSFTLIKELARGKEICGRGIQAKAMEELPSAPRPPPPKLTPPGGREQTQLSAQLN